MKSNQLNTDIIKYFALMTIFWGLIGMSIGVLIAAQLVWPALNFDTPWLTYSRIRPLHTNLVIFGFGASALITSSLYIVQKTCNTSLYAPRLTKLMFWGWQLVIFCIDIVPCILFILTSEVNF